MIQEELLRITYEELNREHLQLVMTKYTTSFHWDEDKESRLKIVRQQLDEIEDALYGRSIDRLETIVKHLEGELERIGYGKK